MLSPLPRHSDWAYYFAHSPSRVSLPRYGSQVGLCIVLFEACSAFTRVTACTLALPPIRGTHSEGFSYFVTSIAAPVASGWSSCRVGLTPTGKRRLCTAHASNGHPCRFTAGDRGRCQCAPSKWTPAPPPSSGDKPQTCAIQRAKFDSLNCIGPTSPRRHSAGADQPEAKVEAIHTEP